MTSNLYTSRTSSTLAALTTMATSTLKVVAVLNSSLTTAAALAVAGTTGALATYMAESQHSSSYAHPYYSKYTSGNSTAMANDNTNINTILYHNTNNSNNITDYNNLNASNYNTSLTLLTPAVNMSHSQIAGSLEHINSSFIIPNSSNSSLVDGLMIDHLPLQLLTSTASSKVNLDIEIDIQLLTSDYEGSTVSCI